MGSVIRWEKLLSRQQWHEWPVFVVEDMDVRDVEVANISDWFVNNTSKIAISISPCPQLPAHHHTVMRYNVKPLADVC